MNDGTLKVDIAASGVTDLRNSMHAGVPASVLASADRLDAGTFAQRGNDWLPVQSIEFTSSMQSVVGMFHATPTVWYGELASARSRIGDLRLNKASGGAWAHTYGRHYHACAAAGVRYHQHQYGLSLGVDTLISVKDGQLLAGILSGYSDSALDFQAGTSAKTGSYYLGGYASWLFSNDYYVDGLVKVNRFDNKSDVRMSTGTGTGDSYSNHGAGVVLEFGRYIALHSDWFIEPFTRWTALWVEGKTYTLSNLTNANNHPAYSWLTHIGATVGRNFQSADGTIIHPYMTVSLVRELAKKTEITVNRDVFHHERSGTRGDVSIGVAAQYSPNFQLHANIDYSKGQKIEQPWELNLGVRYVW